MIIRPGAFRYRPTVLTRATSNIPLTSSNVSIRGSSLTLTRADATSCATVTDFEGLVKVCKANEARCSGARRVETLIPSGTSSALLASGANISLTLAAGSYWFSMGAGTGTATFSGTSGVTGTLSANATNRTAVFKTVSAGTFVITASVADLINLMVEVG